MIDSYEYLGPHICDTNIPGERKQDNVTPAHSGGSWQLSENIWATCFTTLDLGEIAYLDCVRSIVLQLRQGSPMGPVIRERLLVPLDDDWHPCGDERSFRKVHGMPIMFGVPKGATLKGEPYPNANVFALRWYTLPFRHAMGKLVNLHNEMTSPEEHDEMLAHTRTEWMQFRLNEAEDDIEILQEAQLLHQKGYEPHGEFCSLGPGRHMVLGMTAPVASDESCLSWCAGDSIPTVKKTRDIPYGCHGPIAPVEFTWNRESGLYEWTRTGDTFTVEGRTIGEASFNRVGGEWVIAVRSMQIDGGTYWYRTPDLFEGVGEATLNNTHGAWSPRHSYLCPDGVLRIFINDPYRSPYRHKRNPLYAFEVNPDTFEYSEARVVFDSFKEGLPFDPPFVDMSKLAPHSNGEQILIFRMISQRMTYNHHSIKNFDEHQQRLAGLHAVRLNYKEDVGSRWSFENLKI